MWLQAVHQALDQDPALVVHVTADNAFPSLCCHYCELSTTTYEDRWSHAVLDRCPWKQVGLWLGFGLFRCCCLQLPDASRCCFPGSASRT